MPSSSSGGQGIAQRLSWISAFRIVATLLLLGAYAAHLFSRPLPLELGPAEAWLFVLVGLSFFASLIYSLWLRDGRGLGALAVIQILGDAAFAAGLTSLTGGLESPFIFVFLLAVLLGAVVLDQRGALLAAGANSIALIAMALVRWSVEQPRPPAAQWLFPVLVDVMAQFLVGALSGYLARQLTATGGRLVEREADLSALANLQRQILSCMPSGLMTLDPSGRITFVNRAATQILGLHEPQLPLIDSLLPGVQKLAPHPRRHELKISNRPEDKVLGLSVVPLEGGEPGDALVVFQDLTALRRAQEELARADRLASLGKLSAQLAHEIRNPLASMRGAAQLLAEGNSTGLVTTRLTGILVREADRLGGLVEDFLRFARPSSPRRQKVDLAELAHQTVELLRVDPLANSVRLSENVEPVQAEVDPDQIRQVLINLVRNALAAAGAGGEVRVHARPVEEGAELEVWDSAGKIAEEDLPRLFEPFFSRHPAGTGLGLSMVHTIVAAHEGRVRVSSSPGRGTSFVVSLPGGAELQRADTNR